MGISATLNQQDAEVEENEKNYLHMRCAEPFYRPKAVVSVRPLSLARRWLRLFPDSTWLEPSSLYSSGIHDRRGVVAVIGHTSSCSLKEDRNGGHLPTKAGEALCEDILHRACAVVRW